MFDETLDETLDFTDDFNVSMTYETGGDDTLSVDTDMVALAMSYQLALAESVALLDDLEVETFSGAFAADQFSISDSALTAILYGRVLSTDSLTSFDVIVAGLLSDRSDSNDLVVADSVAAGLWHDVVATDSTDVTESWLADTQYQRSDSDSLVIPDVIHTWMAADGQLQVDIEGEATLNAVLMKRKTGTPAVVVPPSRTVSIPKTPPEVVPHYIVNPNPPTDRNR